MKILIVEDQLELANNIQTYLEQEGYVCEVAGTYAKGEDKIVSFEYDCIVLDIMLPDGDGLKLLQLLKAEKKGGSVLIISAKNSLDDKIRGLDLGADDYLTKPFHLPELNARLRAIYRRKNLEGDAVVRFNEIMINTSLNQVTVNDTILDLTKKEFDLLLYFITNKNRVLTRQAIAEHLWGDYTDNLANFDFVYQHVKNLRKKISQANGKDYIGTEYGLGYRFNTNVK
ncbi:MAG: response regulator transcription factor [Cyclobacteriaceae bacterium]|nr:response regulator transcription factor [Cyclobacteriaceae bacterium]MDH4295221.1 response regulator transcription factor [Cyclobacteriaceae bacterium]MDH5247885.1 response regulator transcription factor [Cyclobacteriaceae bacterium]